jgi:mono/diheme cytochrome c family protein
MMEWKNLFTLLPLPADWMQVLLFVAFGLHLLFVLLMLGTAIIGFVSYIKEKIDGDDTKNRLSGSVMRAHLAFKALAVVLGVGPLLVIQVLYYKGFFTATGLFSYAWIGVIPLLIAAFLAIEAFEYKMEKGRLINIVFGTIGVITLFTVPLIFTGAFSLMERPEHWDKFASGGILANYGYLYHWALRYLHIIGAAIVIGGVFHMVFIGSNDPKKSEALKNWTLAGILMQVLVGIPLLLSIGQSYTFGFIAGITIGVVAAVIGLVMLVVSYKNPDKPVKRALPVMYLMIVVFISMISARQVVQDKVLMGLREESQKELKAEAETFQKYQKYAMGAYKEKLNTVYDNGKTIYDKSCMPCHGVNGKGDGYAANRLLVKAEDLSAIKGSRDYIRNVLLKGWDGSAMPYFKIFDKYKIDSLLDELDNRFGMFTKPEQNNAGIGEQAVKEWNSVCATCHGIDGAVAEFGKTLRPMPPDFRHFHLDQARAMDIITNGYEGTAMQPFRSLPESVRRELTVYISDLYITKK